MIGESGKRGKHPAAPWRNFYGRRHGKRLRKGQAGLLETRLAELARALQADHAEKRGHH